MKDYVHKARGQHPQAWNHGISDNEAMATEVCASSTERIRPIPIAIPLVDLDEQDMEEHNFSMREPNLEEHALRELMTMGGEAIMVRPRTTDSSNDIVVIYIRQWPDREA
eukprot:16444764-Heterocapsa_arctica.AAC.1